MQAGNAARLVAMVAALAACSAVAVHAPGHVSMDTSIQLYEAHTGQSLSWNPPFMSALMRWLQGGEMATAALVLLCSGLIYGAYALVAGTATPLPQRVVPLWRVVAALLLVLNPVVAIYVGIVWKDVLFAALLAGGAAFGLAGAHGATAWRWTCALVAVVLLAAALLTRQQGVFMAPVLLGVCMLALARGATRAGRLAVCLLLPSVFCASAFALQAASAAAIRDDGGRSSSIGYRSIMIFDMMGMVAYTQLPPEQLAYPISQIQWQAIRKVYQPTRIDNIALDPAAEAWVASLAPRELRHAWWSLLKQNPRAYLHHRFSSYATLLGLHGIGPTMPVHIGVEGNSEYLKAVNVREGRDQRDLFVYRFASQFFGWPLYFHAFWLAALAASALLLLRSRMEGQQRCCLALVLLAVAAMFLSFLPTMISCDFRYLFAVIPLTSLVLLTLLLGEPSGRSQAEPSYA